MNFNNEYDLQIDLAKHLRESGYLTYTEIEVKGGRGGRADIVAVKPSYANKDVRIYEVKNNRSTFDNDLKYEKYLDVCHRLYIACPKGLIDKDEIPDKVGLMYRNENGWYTVKAPKRNNPKDFNIDFVLSLLYRGYEEDILQRRLRDRINAKDNVALKYKAKNIGCEIARRLDRDRETKIEEWVMEVNKLFKEYLDIDPSSFSSNLPSAWEIEDILSSVSGTLKEVNNIKMIGEYLRNLNLPEENEKSSEGYCVRSEIMEGKKGTHKRYIGKMVIEGPEMGYWVSDDIIKILSEKGLDTITHPMLDDKVKQVGEIILIYRDETK